MRIVIFAVGTQGDARPNVALGAALAGLGHDVVVVTSREFEAMVRAAGLGFAPLSADFQAMMRAHKDEFDGKPALLLAWYGLRKLREMAHSWVAESLPAVEGAGLVIGSSTGLYLAASVAEARDIPFVRATLQPLEPSRDYAPVLIRPGRRPLPPLANRALHTLARGIAWQFGRPVIAHVRRELALPRYPFFGPWRSKRAAAAPLLNGFSPLVVPPPRNWGAHVATTGWWILPERERYEPPPALAAFLEAGPKPIYVGFGSMVSRDDTALARTVLGAIRRLGRRAVIATGWGALAGRTEGDPGILAIPHAPHDWLFPRMALAVHHCGAGTTAASATAGIPTVPVPFLFDQFFWAERLRRLGVATPRLDRATMDEAALAAAITAAEAPPLRDAAARLGAALRAEDGTANAIAALRGWGLLPAA